MKSEALGAIVGPTMRPEALEAAANLGEDDKMSQNPSNLEKEQEALEAETPSKPSTPLPQRIEGTSSAVKVIEEIAHGVKLAVDGALEWAEKKAEQLGEETDDTGPYASPATCAPTDLDPIASGVLPAMPAPGCEDKEEVVRDVEERVASPGSRERSGKL